MIYFKWIILLKPHQFLTLRCSQRSYASQVLTGGIGGIWVLEMPQGTVLSQACPFFPPQQWTTASGPPSQCPCAHISSIKRTWREETQKALWKEKTAICMWQIQQNNGDNSHISRYWVPTKCCDVWILYIHYF